jgi:RIO kinase 1
MALKASKRKKPRREDKPLKERDKFSERSLGNYSTDAIMGFINTRVIDKLDYPISQGKEAVVFRASKKFGKGEKFVAVKAFKLETTSFRRMQKYLDERFGKNEPTLRGFVRKWAAKEFSNLQICERKGVKAPKPLALRDNVVAMQFLGEKGYPSDLLKEYEFESGEEAREMMKKVLENARSLFKAGLVHADLSEYNVMVHKGEPFFIDFGQSVVLSHPNSREFLERDVSNIVNFFSGKGIKADFGEAIKFITSKESKTK